MRKNKKLIIIAVVVGIVLMGSLAGAAFAQTTSTDQTGNTLLARVAAILGIEQQTVEDAFAQAQKDMQTEALDAYLAKLVESGKLTQEQADQYKTWMQSKPDVQIGPSFGMPGSGRLYKMGGFGGFRCGPGFDKLPAPPSTTTQ